MKTEAFFKKMSNVGKYDHPPRMNVVNQVMARIHSSGLEEENRYDFLSWTAAVSSGIAVIMGVTALCVPHTTTDPLLEFILTMPWGLL